MEKQEKHLIATLLVLLLIPVLVACEDSNKDSRIAFQVSPYYTVEEFDLLVDTGTLHGCCTDGENIYLLVTSYEN